MKMLYYIAESLHIENKSFANHLIKRFDTLEEAREYLEDVIFDWHYDGLKASSMDVDGECWGAEALDEDFMVVHQYHIFATPMFMAGGSEGL